MDDNFNIYREEILVVDDMKPNRRILERIITDMGYQAVTAGSAMEAIELVKEHMPSLFILDISMPVMDGFELCKILKSDVHTRDIPVMFISAFSGTEDIVKSFTVGGVDYISKPFVPAEVSARVNNQLGMFRMKREREIYNNKLNKLINEQAQQLEEEKKKVLYALATINARLSKKPASHINNLKYNCRLLAQGMQLSPKFDQLVSNAFIENIEVAAPLHNLGMIAISKDILEKRKVSKLSEKDDREYKTHTIIGADILEEIESGDIKNEFFGMVIDIAKHHHENWDGSGFPDGLKETDIPLAARVVSIIRSFEGFTNGSKGNMNVDEAVDAMNAKNGIFFDPDIFDIFSKIRKHLKVGGAQPEC